jgi:hypothetical protein
MRCIGPGMHFDTTVFSTLRAFSADRVRLLTRMHRLWFTVSDSFYRLIDLPAFCLQADGFRACHTRSSSDRGGKVRLFSSDQLPWVVRQNLLATSAVACCRPTCESLSLA